MTPPVGPETEPAGLSEARLAVLEYEHSDLSPGDEDGHLIAELLAEVRRLQRALVDDPARDCTDAAHPAWWRGHAAGVASVCAILTRVLDGETRIGTCASDALNALTQRIAEMQRALAEARADAERLDWLEAHAAEVSYSPRTGGRGVLLLDVAYSRGAITGMIGVAHGATVREALDRARSTPEGSRDA